MYITRWVISGSVLADQVDIRNWRQQVFNCTNNNDGFHRFVLHRVQRVLERVVQKHATFDPRDLEYLHPGFGEVVIFVGCTRTSEESGMAFFMYRYGQGGVWKWNVLSVYKDDETTHISSRNAYRYTKRIMEALIALLVPVPDFIESVAMGFHGVLQKHNVQRDVSSFIQHPDVALLRGLLKEHCKRGDIKHALSWRSK